MLKILKKYIIFFKNFLKSYFKTYTKLMVGLLSLIFIYILLMTLGELHNNHINNIFEPWVVINNTLFFILLVLILDFPKIIYIFKKELFKLNSK
jgi:hypothetical protein